MNVVSFPIPKEAEWYYLDNGVDQGTAWKEPSFDESAWQTGRGKLGYSDGAVTVLSYGPDPNNKFTTYYFRKKFSVPAVSALADTLVLNLLRDDGALVYINGQEVVRSNMPAGPVAYPTFSSAVVSDQDELTYFEYHIPRAVLINGTNTIAVEIHQCNSSSSDLGFDLELKELRVPAILLRGPYLQVATPTGIHIRWRTDQPTPSRVRYGTAPGTLPGVQDDPALVTEHEIVLQGLSARTKYWYSIGSFEQPLQGDADNYFTTLPLPGAKGLVRIGVLGDCGNNSANQFMARDELQHYLGGNTMDAWILLGDNAYYYGSDEEYQAEFFNIYKDRFLKQSPLYPAPGNHDYAYDNPDAQNNHAVPYYRVFSMPVRGEAGGYPSGNPAYYSFDVGNIHFLSLDSYGKEDNSTRLYDTLGKQVQWIKNDLEANRNKDWIVAYWHHPPFTMGSHNSDTEGDLAAIRTNFIRILERYGVDLVLCGHSHVYERSKLQKGHYDAEATFDPAVHDLSASSGYYYDGSGNSCPYIKRAATGNQGTVYVVSGSAGQLGGAQGEFPHNAMFYSNTETGGSLILEVQDNRLDARWICTDGLIRDRFTMMKEAGVKKTYNIIQGDRLTLSASFIGSYSWQPGGETGRSITVTPPAAGSYVYTVRDNFSCIADTFVVHVAASEILPAATGLVKGSYDITEKSIRLTWQLLQESDALHFDMERSADGKDFTAIARTSVAGGATHEYRYADNRLEPGVAVYYYRIKQVNRNGKSIYSPAVAVQVPASATDFDVQLVPNPAQGNSMKIRLLSGGNMPATIRLIDAAGKVVLDKRMVLTATLQPFLPPVKKGMYFLSITTGKTVVTKQVVIK